MALYGRSLCNCHTLIIHQTQIGPTPRSRAFSWVLLWVTAPLRLARSGIFSCSGLNLSRDQQLQVKSGPCGAASPPRVPTPTTRQKVSCRYLWRGHLQMAIWSPKPAFFTETLPAYHHPDTLFPLPVSLGPPKPCPSSTCCPRIRQASQLKYQKQYGKASFDHGPTPPAPSFIKYLVSRMIFLFG